MVKENKMIQNKNKFLLLAISALLCANLFASNVDNASDKEEVVSIARLKEFKKAHECENAKRNALVAAAQLSLSAAKFYNKKEQNSSKQSFLKRINPLGVLSFIYGIVRWKKLHSDNADYDLAIQNSLVTVHLRNALYGVAEIAPATERAAIQQSEDVLGSIKKSDVGKKAKKLMGKVLSKYDKSISDYVKNLFGDRELKGVFESFFSNDYSAPTVDVVLGLHKKYLSRNISKEDKKLSKELFALMPPKTNAPTTTPLIFNVLSKCFLAQQAGVSKKEANKIAVEMLAPIVAKLVVPVIIRP